MSLFRLKIFVVLFSIFTIACSLFAATQDVHVGVGFTFAPNDVTVNAGDTVHWIWDTSGHSTTSTTAPGGCTAGGTDPWDSTVLLMGATFDHTFNGAGDYSYKCIPHCGMGMTGIVRVVDFDITCTPSTISAQQNGSGTATCTVSSLNNFNAAVDLSVAGLPSGVTFGFSADPVTPPAGGTADSILTLNVDNTVAPGSYPFTLSGQNGDRTKTVNLVLAIPLFIDDFEDGNAMDWTFVKGTWSVVGGSLVGTHDRKATGLAPFQMSGFESVEVLMQTNGGAGTRTSLIGWFADKKNLVELLMKEDEDKWVLKQRINGAVVSKGKATATILPNTDYRVRVTYDQTSDTFQVFIDGVLLFPVNAVSPPNGAPGVRVKSTTSTFGEILVF
jgi:plastocyanin